MIYSYNQQLVDKRNEKGLTLRQAAKGIGIPRLGLFLLENGYYYPSKKTLAKIESFYDFKLDFSDGKDYPNSSESNPHKRPKLGKKKLIITGSVCLMSIAMIITGATLFKDATSNESNYGETYTEVRNYVKENGKVGRDIVTDLEYHYITEKNLFGQGTISFYDKNSILYFNDCTVSSNTYWSDRPELGICRVKYLFGGSLISSSFSCQYTLGSSKAGIYFTCEAIFENKLVDRVTNLKVTSSGGYDINEEFATELFNRKLMEIPECFDVIMSAHLGKEVSFYNDFLPAREQGRRVNFVSQAVGLGLLIPGIIGAFITITLLLLTIIKKIKPFEQLIDNGDGEKSIKAVPDNLKINIGVPDYMLIWLSNILAFGSILLIFFSSIGGAIFDLPGIFYNEYFLDFLRICFIVAPFLRQLIMFRSMKKMSSVIIEILKYLLLHAFIATMFTTAIGVADLWGYDIANLVYKYVPSNVFLAVALNNTVFLFLFFIPTAFKKRGKKWTSIWRLFSLIPVALIVVVTIVGNSYELFYGVQKNIYLIFWISNSYLPLSIAGVLFIYATFFIKFFFRRKYGEVGFNLFQNGNMYTYIINIVCSLIVLLVGLFDLFFINSELGYYLGLGNNYWILTIIPFILLSKFGPNLLQISHVEDEFVIEE